MFLGRRIICFLFVCTSASAALRGNNGHEKDDTQRELAAYFCGCVECTESVFRETMAGDVSCGARIEWLQAAMASTEEDACNQVSGIEFPNICGKCNPAICTSPPSKPPHCGCDKCTDEVWNRNIGEQTCGELIDLVQTVLSNVYPTENDACEFVSGLSECRNCDPAMCSNGPSVITVTNPPTTTSNEASFYCGCETCTEQAWNADAGGHTCGDRIEFLLSQPQFYQSEREACVQVARLEFPSVCGPACDPDKCTAKPESVLINDYVVNNPDSSLLGSNVIVFSPDMAVGHIQAVFDGIYETQQNDEMGSRRHALYFLPGVYGTQDQPLQVRIGYYTEVAGLGASPTDVQIIGKIEVYNRCFEPAPYDEGKFIPTSNNYAVCFALNNFWRSLSNLSININSRGQDQCRATANFWAISQASSMRRVDIRGGDLSLMDYCNQPGFASGGFMADSRTGKVINGSQQQFLARNSNVAQWSGSVWNQAFSGVIGAPDDSSYPDPPFTNVENTPLGREKPYLFVDNTGEYNVRIPSARRETKGITWSDNSLTPGRTVPVSDFYLATPTDSVERINQELASGKHLIFTPGVYAISTSIMVKRADTVVLGLGQATLTATNGATPLKIDDLPGIIIAGITIDAGAVESPVLLQVGAPKIQVSTTRATSRQFDSSNPTTLHDIYFRIGGPHIGKTNIALEVNSDNVLIDHTWIWRGDHGVENFDENDGFDGDNQRWTFNIGRNGIVVNGNDVTAFGLFVEHFQEYNLIWNGERGRVYFFQNELPYEPPTQAEWMASDGTKGWAAYKVSDSVVSHELWCGSVYCYNRNNPSVETENGFEVPETPGVVLNHVMTRNLSGPGIINSVVNGVGDLVNDDFKGPNYVNRYPVQ